MLFSVIYAGHFVMVPLNLTYLHFLQHYFFEHLFILIYLTAINVDTVRSDELVLTRHSISSAFLCVLLRPFKLDTLQLSWFVCSFQLDCGHGRRAFAVIVRSFIVWPPYMMDASVTASLHCYYAASVLLNKWHSVVPTIKHVLLSSLLTYTFFLN